MKKSIVVFISLLILVALFSTSCSAIFRTTGAGKIMDKTYDFTNFTGIQISDALQFEIKQADSYSVVISAHENVFEHLNIHQSDNTLIIGMKFFPYNTFGTKITITMPQLSKLAASGACDGTATGFDSNNDLEISLSGASDLNTDLKAGKTKLGMSGEAKIIGDLTATDTQINLSGACDLNMILNTGETVISATGSGDFRGTLQALDCQITLMGASTCELTGSAGNTVIKASGASEMNSPNLVLQSANVSLDGASDASIHTDGTLNIDISGASTLNYTGSPTMGIISVSGASEINHR
jgi:hypothetical protein